MHSKERRKNLILSIIIDNPVMSQHDLVRELDGRGFPTSQGTISKDLRELGISKTVGQDGKPRYVLPSEQRASLAPQEISRKIEELLIDVQRAASLVVAQTLPGNASALAVFLDKAHFPEVVGTVAGDDTIFIAARNDKEAESLCNRLFELIA